MEKPTRQNYKEWYQQRVDRTIRVMEKQTVIPGHQVLSEGLSNKVLYDNGYILNTKNDCMEKK